MASIKTEIHCVRANVVVSPCGGGVAATAKTEIHCDIARKEGIMGVLLPRGKNAKTEINWTLRVGVSVMILLLMIIVLIFVNLGG